MRDILIVAIGDSYSSGEGNPDHAIPTPGARSAPYAEQMWAEGGNASMTEQNTECALLDPCAVVPGRIQPLE